MTDNTQELDVILNEVRYASWSMGLQSSSQEDLHSSSNNSRGTSEAKQALLDWHVSRASLAKSIGALDGSLLTPDSGTNAGIMTP